MSKNDPVVHKEFSPPPPDDKDAITVITLSTLFFLFVISALVFG